MQHFDSLEDYHHYLGFPKPSHPMFSVTTIDAEVSKSMRQSSPPISMNFYIIKLKWDKTCQLYYGRTQYDFTSGTLVFVAPGQAVGWEASQETIEQHGLMLMIHQDYLRGTELEKRFRKSAFFSYAVHEALHMSEQEEERVKQIFGSIQDEYLSQNDEYSQEIIFSQLDSLLRYAARFYNRQFLNRKEINTHIATKFQAVLTDYFDSGNFKERGLPNIDMIADEMAVSPRYLSDSLKAETGQTAMQHLHQYLVEEAKGLLLTPYISISEVAHQLGFEYPQYFSRMFKKKTGLSPKAYQVQHC